MLRKLVRRSDSVSPGVPAVRRHDNERIDLTLSARTTSIRHVDRRLNARLRLFDVGAPTLRRALERQGRDGLLPAGEDFYACPCCLEALPREAAIAGWLSEEHVPPKGLGGKRLVLTCRACNNTSGHAFDTHAVTRSWADHFAHGKPGRTLPATFCANGIPLRGTAQRTDDGSIHVSANPRQNDPKTQATLLKVLHEYVDQKDSHPRVSFTVHTYFDEAHARYSWIRSAYLAAFAGLGWSYILRPVMQPIRDQLASPDDASLPTHMLRTLGADPSARRILLVDDPDELRCVAVVMGEHTVFLPGLDRPQSYEQVIAAFAREKQLHPQGRLSVNFSGKEVPWPRRATYFLEAGD